MRQARCSAQPPGTSVSDLMATPRRAKAARSTHSPWCLRKRPTKALTHKSSQVKSSRASKSSRVRGDCPAPARVACPASERSRSQVQSSGHAPFGPRAVETVAPREGFNESTRLAGAEAGGDVDDDGHVAVEHQPEVVVLRQLWQRVAVQYRRRQVGGREAPAAERWYAVKE
jgi:hypothetical protein